MNTNRYHAVLVGIDSYSDPTQYRTLKYTKSDAKSLKSTLIETQGSKFSQKTVHLLHDDAEEKLKPTRSNIYDELEIMCGDAQEHDLILFYFAGHGFDHDNHSYLIPCNMPRGKSIISVTDNALRLERILEFMQEFSAPNQTGTTS